MKTSRTTTFLGRHTKAYVIGSHRLGIRDRNRIDAVEIRANSDSDTPDAKTLENTVFPTELDLLASRPRLRSSPSSKPSFLDSKIYAVVGPHRVTLDQLAVLTARTEQANRSDDGACAGEMADTLIDAYCFALTQSAQAVRKIIANSSLFQSPVHQVSLKEGVHSLPDLPFHDVFLI
ncbi:unnamed protein product [Protopolystoma xenopodis]|uniref:Uncharacterized protein n=1 Tax=Protopolystoma xenopodis TaxID=117903 RepID=A0A448WA62_9PLAT|nr:unnamed protein product [Protopolystoma xenopodis]